MVSAGAFMACPRPLAMAGYTVHLSLLTKWEHSQGFSLPGFACRPSGGGGWALPSPLCGAGAGGPGWTGVCGILAMLIP